MSDDSSLQIVIFYGSLVDWSEITNNNYRHKFMRYIHNDVTCCLGRILKTFDIDSFNYNNIFGRFIF